MSYRSGSSDPYNRLYERMVPFHAGFRQSYASLQHLLPQSSFFSKRDLEVFVDRAGQLCHHLEMHHSIEETYIFPILAKRMPSFASGNAHIKEHAAMHSALASLEAYVKKVARALSSSPGKKAVAEGCGQSATSEGTARKAWPKEVYDAEEFKNLLTALGEALFPHLDAEEESLKGVNMKKAGWTEAELARIPM